ncbi:hypothetical protein V2J09_001212 [Rumex salicifolius]
MASKRGLHQPGIEPGSVPWQGTILPLDHWCFDATVKRTSDRVSFRYLLQSSLSIVSSNRLLLRTPNGALCASSLLSRAATHRQPPRSSSPGIACPNLQPLRSSSPNRQPPFALTAAPLAIHHLSPLLSCFNFAQHLVNVIDIHAK